jgi:hypothetical protein
MLFSYFLKEDLRNKATLQDESDDETLDDLEQRPSWPTSVTEKPTPKEEIEVSFQFGNVLYWRFTIKLTPLFASCHIL